MSKYNFCDNQTIGVDDLNGVIKNLYPLPGIADPFVGGASYYATTLNNIIGGALSRGVVPEAEQGLKVSMAGTDKVSIAPGTAIFANGQTITLEEAETVETTPNRKNYIYMVSDFALNKAYPAALTAEAADQDGIIYYVPLAEVEADGSITDTRIYACLAGATVNAAKHMTIKVPLDDYLTADRRGRYNGKFSIAYDFGGDNYNLMIMRCAKKAITIIQKVNGAFEYCCICRDNGNGYFIDDGAVWWETTDSFHTLTVEQNGNEIIFNYNASYISTKEPYFDLWVLSENKVS